MKDFEDVTNLRRNTYNGNPPRRIGGQKGGKGMSEEAKKKEYERICRDLGFIPEVHFVRITRTGAIGYTVGKPDEIKALQKACREKGYRMSRTLQEFPD